MKAIRITLLCGLLLALASTASAQQWTWFSPLNMKTADSRLTMVPGLNPLTALRITTSEANDYQLAFLGLPLQSNGVIDSLTVCYEIMSPGVYIEDIWLLRMRAPDAADLMVAQSPGYPPASGPTCFTAVAVNGAVTGAITMRLQLNFSDASGVIEIGAIGIHTSPIIVGINDDQASKPPSVSLLDQNRPNPFNPATRISFDLPRAQHATLDIYSVDGLRLRTLVQGELIAGRHDMDWDGRDDRGRTLPSGVYLYRLKTEDREESHRMTLIR